MKNLILGNLEGYLNLVIKFREKLLRNNESISSEKFRLEYSWEQDII